jgi:hypothetical protein
MATVANNQGGIWNRALVVAAMDGRLDVCRLIVEDVRVDVNQRVAGTPRPRFSPGSSYVHGVLPPLSTSKSVRQIDPSIPDNSSHNRRH